MSTPKSSVLEAAKRYVLAALGLESELAASAANSNLLRAYRSGGLPKEGRLAHATYSFHGAGCRFEEDSGRVVDIELRQNGRYAHEFDAWRLVWFMESEGHPLSLSVITESLEALRRDGSIRLSELGGDGEAAYQLASPDSERGQ